MGQTDDKQRIAVLEQEVARLKQRDGAEAQATSESVDDGPEIDFVAASPIGRSRAIIIAALFAVASLAIMIAVFSALSSGFDSLARKAANSLSPVVDENPGAAPTPEARLGGDNVPASNGGDDKGGPSGGSGASGPEKQGPTDEAPRVPGL